MATGDSHTWQDVRNAVRALARAPGLAAVVILTLALGIGANTAIFTIVNSLLLRALPVAEPQQLVMLSSASAINAGYPAGWSYSIWEQIRQRTQPSRGSSGESPTESSDRRADVISAGTDRDASGGALDGTFDGAIAWSGAASVQFDLAQAGESDLVDGLFVSGDFFTTLGVPALIGRTFTAADDERGGGSEGPVAVISHGLWQRRFGGAADVIGRALIVEHVPFTIVGVTPAGFFGTEVGRAFDVALPIGAEPLLHGAQTWLDEQGPGFLSVMLRLPARQSLDSATATLRALQPRIFDAAMPGEASASSSPSASPAAPTLEPSYRQEFLRDPFTLVPATFGTSPLRAQYERPLLTVLVIVALVLLIACANIANLLLARAAARRHEMSVRLALGAPRWRLARQLLIESVLLAALGALGGLLVATWGSRALVAQLSNLGALVVLDLSLDWRVLTFTAGMTVLTAILFGTAPALTATRVPPIEALKAREATVAQDGRARLSGALIVVQVALSLMLVVAAGLFVRTFARLASVPLGFDRDRVLVTTVNATRAPIAPAALPGFYQRLVDAVAAVPGVAGAAASQMTPSAVGPTMIAVVDVPGRPSSSPRDRTVSVNVVTPGLFRTYGTRLRAGRDFDARDTRQAPLVVVVNDALARRFFPGEEAVGRSLLLPMGPPAQAPPRMTIVGVVEDTVYGSRREPILPAMYQPIAQSAWEPPPVISVSVRAAVGSPTGLARSVAAALTAVDPALTFSFRPLTDQVEAGVTQERLVAILSAIFGGLALLLAALGLYGITSHAVAGRRMEIGVRVALGAQRASVIRLVLRRSLGLTAIGIVVGLAGAAAVTRYIEAMLFGLTPLDPLTFVAVPLVFAMVATLAAFLPADRATRLDPLLALRRE